MIFISDVDNTLIYSYKHKIPSPVLVEKISSNEQAFMTETSYQFFKDADWLNMVLITTRTLEQYMRVELPNKSKIKDVYLCNGAIRLHNGSVDQEWLHTSQKMAEYTAQALDKTEEQLHKYTSKVKIRRKENYMIVCSEVSQTMADTLKHASNGCDVLDICYTGSKLYFIPKFFSKGEAIRRMCRLPEYNDTPIIAAGDSPMDKSMLLEVDMCITPETLEGLGKLKRNVVIPSHINFTDGICTVLATVRNILDIA